MTFNTHFVFQTKKVAKQHQLTIKLISKQARQETISTYVILIFILGCKSMLILFLLACIGDFPCHAIED